MDFVHFGLRMQIEEMFLDWCKEEGVAEKPNSLVVFMMLQGWLNEEKHCKKSFSIGIVFRTFIQCTSCECS